MTVFRFDAFLPFVPGRPQPVLVRLISVVRTRSIVTMLGISAFFGGCTVVHAQELASTGASAVQPKSATRPSLSKPAWRDLSPAQQQALEPLASAWDGLSESHKRKWLALSRSHAKLSPAEQAVQHSRMKEWASLTQQQRAQARFNFAEVKQLPADERKAKWEAYQALSPEEKRKLAERAPTKPPGVAPTIRPVPTRKLAPARSPSPSPSPGGDLAAPSVPAAPSLKPANAS